MATTYTPIATTTLGSNQSTVSFSSIPSTYTDLILILNAKTNASGSDSYYGLAFNGDNTSGLYSSTRLYGDGSAVSNRYSNINYLGLWSMSGNPASFGINILNIQNYANSTTYKTTLARNNNAGATTQACVGLWRNTNAINSITIYPEPVSGAGQLWISGSTFTLYGIASA